MVTASGDDEAGNPALRLRRRRVDFTPTADRPRRRQGCDLTDAAERHVNYSLTVTNKGPDTATNVELADPAPAGITYLTANPSQGTCNVAPAIITCSLGTIAPGQTVTIAITGRATTVGSHTNTATVTGGGGRETNPADNIDTAVTVVPAPLRPPTVKPEPPVARGLPLAHRHAEDDQGRRQAGDDVTAKVTAGKKRMKGAKVLVKGAGVSRRPPARTARASRSLRINPRKPGLDHDHDVESKQKLCGAKRIGVVGVFLPPLTG